MTHTDLLDPRCEELSSASPLRDAVNIPAGEIESRDFELPAPGGLVRVAEFGADTDLAIAALRKLGREASRETTLQFGSPEARFRLWKPNPLIEAYASREPPGKALDIACGTGRDAVELASLGWDVTGIDHLPDALQRAEHLASLHTLSARFVLRHVNADYLPDENVNLICMFFYLNHTLIEKSQEKLEPGGLLMLEMFSDVNRAHFGRPSSERFVLKSREVLHLLPDLAVVHHSEEWRESGKHTVRFVGRKSALGT